MKNKGAVSVLVAVSAFALLIASAIGIELSRMYIVQERLQTALDAASLLAARELGSSSLDGDTTAIFWSNFAVSHQSTGLGPFQSQSAGPVITPVNATTVTVQANVVLPLVFGKLLGISQVTMSEHAQAVRSVMGMELALVLDNTDSLEASGIDALHCGAMTLVDIVYGASLPTQNGSQCNPGTGPDTVNNLWVSVVPFAGEMNVFGATYGGANGQTIPSGWLVSGTAGTVSRARYGSNGWMGCVMARYSGYNNNAAHVYDVNDANPVQAPFTPFFWPSTYGVYTRESRYGQTTLVGDNDWLLSNGVVTPGSASRSSYGSVAESPLMTTFSADPGGLVTESGVQVGPNLGCDPSPTLPETASRAVVEDHIGSMPMMSRGGTMLPQALQAGWFTISPNWQGFWPNPSLPLASNTPNMRKVLVLMTDGNNQICPCFPSYPLPPPQSTGDTDMVAYGRLLADELGVVSSYNSGFNNIILPTMNNLVSTVCTNIKSQGILIYVILYTHNGTEADQTTQDMLQSCASSPNDYYPAPTAAVMQQAFSQLGGQLSALRISQ
jgi:Flp pilus assembly protein TadG